MKNEVIFDLILSENAKYTDLILENATAIEQEAQLTICSRMFEDLILKTGLVNEYAEYCRKRR